MKQCIIVVALLITIALPAAASAASISIGIAEENGVTGSTATIPVTVSGAEGLGGLDFILAYDPEVLAVTNVTTGSLNKGIFEANASVPGLIAVSMADADGMSGSGNVAVISFNIIGQAGRTSDLALSNIQAFDAATLAGIPVTATDGAFTVKQATVSSPAPSGGEALPAALVAVGLAAGIFAVRKRQG